MLCLAADICFSRNSLCFFNSASFALFARISSLRACTDDDSDMVISRASGPDPWFLVSPRVARKVVTRPLSETSALIVVCTVLGVIQDRRTRRLINAAVPD